MLILHVDPFLSLYFGWYYVLFVRATVFFFERKSLFFRMTYK